MRDEGDVLGWGKVVGADEALCAVRRRLVGRPGQSTLLNVLRGACRRCGGAQDKPGRAWLGVGLLVYAVLVGAMVIDVLVFQGFLMEGDLFYGCVCPREPGE